MGESKGDTMTTIIYRLTIYRDRAARVTEHDTRAQAQRSITDYERRHGRQMHSIDALPVPGRNDAAGWDAYRLRHGIAAR